VTILGIDHAAAVRRLKDLNLYCADLDDARRAAQDLGRIKDVEAINALIRSVSTDYQDTQAVIEMYERQESGRDVTRSLRAHAAQRMEQLMLSPGRPQTFGVL
jgi:HEAT repeat protein